MQKTQELPYDRRPANRNLRHLQGEYGWPFVGKTIDMFRDPQKLFGHYYERYGPVSRISITGNKCVLLLHPDYAERVLLDREKNFSGKKGWESVMAEFFEGGLVMRDFADHRIHRGIVMGAFKRDAMLSYTDTVRSISKAAVERWGNQGEILFYEEIKRLLLEIAFGVFCWLDESDKDVERVNRAFTDMMEGALGIVRLDLPGFAYHRGLEGRRYLKQFFLERIDQKRASDDKDAFAGFCKAKTEEGEYYSDEDIANHMIFLMLAAHDTTTSAATMAAYYLANDYNLQSNMAIEIEETPKPLGYDTIFREMPLMVGVFYETLRMHPPVSMFLRRTLRECEFGGIRVPADTMVCVPSSYIHRLPEWWKHPNTFDPNRFSEEVHEQRKHNFMWIPFGGGAHKCIGMHFARLLFTLTFAELVSQFQLEYTRPDYYPAKLQHFPFTKPTDDLPLRLRRREHARPV